MKEIFNVCDGSDDDFVYAVTRENMKRLYRDLAARMACMEGWCNYDPNAPKVESAMEPLSSYGTAIPGAHVDEWPLDQIDHDLDGGEYDPQECLDQLESEELGPDQSMIDPEANR